MPDAMTDYNAKLLQWVYDHQLEIGLRATRNITTIAGTLAGLTQSFSHHNQEQADFLVAGYLLEGSYVNIANVEGASLSLRESIIQKLMTASDDLPQMEYIAVHYAMHMLNFPLHAAKEFGMFFDFAYQQARSKY